MPNGIRMGYPSRSRAPPGSTARAGMTPSSSASNLMTQQPPPARGSMTPSSSASNLMTQQLSARGGMTPSASANNLMTQPPPPPKSMPAQPSHPPVVSFRISHRCTQNLCSLTQHSYGSAQANRWQLLWLKKHARLVSGT